MGGTDDPPNLVELTVEEHAEAHRLLWEKYGKWQDEIAWKALTGRIGKEEIIREKQKKSKLGTKLSEESRKKISISKIGKKMKKRSEEHSEKISNLKSKTWVFKDINGKEITIFNLSKFCRENKLSHGNMIMVFNGIRKKHKGYTI